MPHSPDRSAARYRPRSSTADAPCQRPSSPARSPAARRSAATIRRSRSPRCRLRNNRSTPPRPAPRSSMCMCAILRPDAPAWNSNFIARWSSASATAGAMWSSTSPPAPARCSCRARRTLRPRVTEFRLPQVRAQHVVALKPDMCSLDLCTMWFRTRAFINAPEHIAEIARLVRQAGVLPELEVFDSGDIALARQLIGEDAIAAPAFFQIVLGVSYGAAATPETLLYLRNQLPPHSKWAAFGIGPHAYPMLAQALLLGGHVRIGLEDNYYLEKGVKAPHNAALVEKAVTIMRSLGAEPATPAETREILGMGKVRMA